MPEKEVKIPRRVGRPEISDVIKQQIIARGQAGHKRKEIAAETGVKSVKTISKILHAVGVYLPQGRPLRDANVCRDVPGGLHDKHINVNDAAAWARSAYDNMRLKPAYKKQRELPRRLDKKHDAGGIGRTTKF